jgi:hypothetical protein
MLAVLKSSRPVIHAAVLAAMLASVVAGCGGGDAVDEKATADTADTTDARATTAAAGDSHKVAPSAATRIQGVASSLCLGVEGASTTALTPVQILGCDDSASQKWDFTAAGELRAFDGTRCLDVRDASTAPTSVVQSFPCNGGSNQKWTLKSDGTIVGVQSGLCLTVTGGRRSAGTGIDMWPCEGASHQKWNKQNQQSDASSLELRVFLLGGQSNADGRASKAGQKSYPNIDFFYSFQGFSGGGGGILTTLFPGGSEGGENFGPELTFGSTLSDKLGGGTATSRIAIIKYANGGTNLRFQWKAGGSAGTVNDGAEYVAFQQTVASGLTALASKYPGATIKIEGMIWMQGESDAAKNYTSDYADNLTRFIADVRSTYGESLPIVIGRLSNLQTGAGAGTALARETVQNAQSNVAAADSRVGLVNTDAIAVNSDNVHFSVAGQIALGRAFAAEMVKYVSAKPATGKTYKLFPKHSQKALNVEDNSITDGANVIQWGNGNSDNSRWILTDVGSGYFKVEAKSSLKALSVSGDSTADGGDVIQWPYGIGADSRQWKFVLSSDGYYKVVNRRSSKALNVEGASTENGANVIQWGDGNSADNSRWRLEHQ